MHSLVNLKNLKMGQDFFLIVEGVTVARTLSTLTVSNLIERRSNDMVVVWRSAAFVPCTGRLQRYTLACQLERKGRKKDAEDIAVAFLG